jgi:hypothetical protein
MKWSLLGAAVACFGGLQCPANATAEHYYKPGEYDLIKHGLAPNNQYSIVAHGGQDANPEDLHLFLVDARNNKRIGPLEEVHAGLDTAPDAFLAQWSTDSRYVAISYRTDRHINALLVYRIEQRRAFLVTGPAPISTVAPSFKPDDSEITSHYIALEWVTPTRFKLREIAYARDVSSEVTKAVGQFGKLVASEPDILEFSIEAVCDLTRQDKYLIVTVRPGSFDD